MVKGKGGIYPKAKDTFRKEKEHVKKRGNLSEVEMGPFFHLIRGTHQT